jgi:starvation-inducible outer membrane lipoprotein
MKLSRQGLGALVLGACILLPGCATVPPWERGNLAKPQMAFDLNPAQTALREHAYGSREAAISGDAAAGGGCGCY